MSLGRTNSHQKHLQEGDDHITPVQYDLLMPKEILPKGEAGSVLSCACKVFLLPGSILATKLCPTLVHGSHCAKCGQRLLQQHHTHRFITDQTSLSWVCSSFPTGSRASVAEAASCLFEDLDLSSSHPSLPSGHKEACNRLQYVMGVLMEMKAW